MGTCKSSLARDTDSRWRQKIEQKRINYTKTYDVAVSTYITSAKRIDRDKCLRLKARIEMCEELLNY